MWFNDQRPAEIYAIQYPTMDACNEAAFRYEAMANEDTANISGFTWDCGTFDASKKNPGL